jgi:hypothetical protein
MFLIFRSIYIFIYIKREKKIAITLKYFNTIAENTKTFWYIVSFILIRSFYGLQRKIIECNNTRKKYLSEQKHYQWDYFQWGGGKIKLNVFIRCPKENIEWTTWLAIHLFQLQPLPYVWFIEYWTKQYNLLDVQHVLVTYAHP